MGTLFGVHFLNHRWLNCRFSIKDIKVKEKASVHELSFVFYEKSLIYICKIDKSVTLATLVLSLLVYTTVRREVGLWESLLSLKINPIRNQFASTITHDPNPRCRLNFFFFRLVKSREDSAKIPLPAKEVQRSASLAVAHTASGLPRFEPLAVNNAREPSCPLGRVRTHAAFYGG